LRGTCAVVRFSLALVVGASVTCRRPPPPAPEASLPTLGAVDVQAEPHPAKDTPRIDTAAVTERVRAFMNTSGLVATPKAVDAGTHGPVVRINGRVAIELVTVEKKGLCRAAVQLTLSTRPSDAPGALSEELSALGEERFEVGATVDLEQLAQKLVERTATDLLSGLAARARLRRAAPGDLHAAIVGDGGTELRQAAIRAIGERRIAAEAPTLLALLNAPDEPIRDAALGALILLRDQRAVTQLTRDRSFHDRREMFKIMDAISLIGGDEARDYLAFVAQSHDDQEVRELARAASDRMRRDAAKPSP
jgi:hypothetical protein